MDSKKEIFESIYRDKKWGNETSQRETRSGSGSTLQASAYIRERAIFLFRLLGIKTILDVPCGESNLIRNMDLDGFIYHGADIVEEVIEQNKAIFSDDPSKSFSVIDALNSPLPKVDMIMCRDLVIHLPNAAINTLLANIKRSGSTWLLMTHCTGEQNGWLNRDIDFGHYRDVNLTLPPFTQPVPQLLLPEVFAHKYMGLWKIEDLAVS